MSAIAKSTLTVDGNTVHLSMPFAKVDKAKRLVTGFATLDNVDTQGDIVLAEASKRAFARARGNLREMHQPIAAGRIVEFKEDKFYDKDTKKFYTGIFVSAYVSKGAESTWEKVLDGTLSGFSIGGDIVDADNEFSKEAGTDVRVIKDYNLVELSLVDNPANHLANVFSFQKSAQGSVMKGMVAETEMFVVYVCPADETTAIKNSETSDPCPQCGGKMEDAGWFEEGPDRADKVEEIVTKFLDPLAKEAAPTFDEGGVEMEKGTQPEEAPEVETEEVSGVEVVEPVEAEEVDETEGTEEGGLDEPPAESPEEVVDEEDEISKKIDALHKAIEDTLANTKGEFAEQVEEIKKFVKDEMEPLVNKTSQLEQKLSELGEKQEAQKSALANMEARLEKMNDSDAFRKSGDVEDTKPVTVQKNAKWSPGAFSGKGDTSRYFSASDL